MTLPRPTLAGVSLAACTVALGTCLGVKLANQDLVTLFYALALISLAKAIFTWGEARGFSIRNDDGTLHAANIVRNSVMTLVAVPIVLMLAAPMAMVAFQLAR